MKFLKRHKANASASASTEPPKEQYGLFSLHEAPNADIDIVAVHGLGGHFKETWTDNDSKQLWLRDFLPSQLKDVGLAARVMSYGYDSTTAFSKSVTDIEDQATMLLNALALERQSPPENKRPLIFIAHSLGGIIVKKAMIIAHERSSIYGTVLNSVRALVLFGVPHRGSDLAYWSTFAARLLNTVQLGLRTNTSFVEALARNSQTFTDISQSFIERAAPLKIRTFYETEKLYGNLIVDKDSARLGLPNEVSGGVTAADHRTICKFNDKDSQRYRPVWKAIQMLCANPEEVQASTVARNQSESLFIVPFSRDPLFLGRADIINLVDTKFKSERRVALTGIGGVGKSQIAIEYCYRYRDQHPDSNIFWVHAGTKERFEQAFKAIARNCRLPGWDDPAKNPLDLVYDWLCADNSWLMILDNADDKDVFFDQRPTTSPQRPEAQRATLPFSTYLPQTSRRGSMLLTSRNRDAAFRLTNTVEDIIDVPYMNRDDATALLCKKLPKDLSSDDEKLELVELLEYLPLAITQAAAYISVRRTRMTIARYSDFLRKNEQILLDDMGDLRRDPTVPSSVLLTWHISFDQINEENRPAAELLSLMSVFDRQGIPQSLLQGEGEDDLDFENRLAPLEEFSLISLEDSGRSFQMHRLIQLAIRSWLERHGDTDHWKEIAARVVAKSLPTWEYKFWKTWDTLLPHSEITSNYVSSNTESQLLHAAILHNTAWYFQVRGRYAAAKERCQRALDIRLDLLGEDDVEIARSLLLLANLQSLYKGGHRLEHKEAETMCRRALEIFGRVQRKDSQGSMPARNQLAIMLLGTRHDKKVEEAVEIFQSVLASGEQNLGLEHPSTLMFMHNLALAFSNQHKYEEAESLYCKNLEIKLRILGEDDPSTMISMNSLARTLCYQERYEEAHEFAQRALDLRKGVLGEDHPDTLHTMQLLSHILNCQDKSREAEELCRHALAVHKTALGDNAPKTMECTYVLTRSLVRQHKYEEAEESLRKIHNGRPEWWDDENWDVFLELFAATLSKLGKHDEAAGISRQRVLSEDTSSNDWETIKDSSSDLSEQSATENHLRPRSASLPDLPSEIPEMGRRMPL